MRFDNPRLLTVGVEVISLNELRRRASPAALSRLAAPLRVDFHHLLLVSDGHGKHVVDFVEYDLVPGSVLLVRPGQVQQWRDFHRVQGQLAFISGEALAPSVGRSDVDMRLLNLASWPAAYQPRKELFLHALTDMERLSVDVARYEGTDVEAAIIRHELLTLLLRLTRELRRDTLQLQPVREAEVYAQFATALELTYSKRPSVLDLAQRLGYSESTLSRASLASTGRTAKQAIDERIALEAKRLLVHSHASSAHIGHQLGFSEPTNFTKFFKRTVGCTPLEFQQTHLSRSAPIATKSL
ncbi:AraC family transcriptional regulator [Xanthomonas campestris pv. campestris]|uniref:helix-turn-helix transcriptional regulator n=1 Tax=Xanthomonas campestris TaxID=339 RepID=UPI00388EB975